MRLEALSVSFVSLLLLSFSLIALSAAPSRVSLRTRALPHGAGRSALRSRPRIAQRPSGIAPKGISANQAYESVTTILRWFRVAQHNQLLFELLPQFFNFQFNNVRTVMVHVLPGLHLIVELAKEKNISRRTVEKVVETARYMKPNSTQTV